MNPTQLRAHTPIYQLYEANVLTPKTYNWLTAIGVHNVEEMAIAYKVEDDKTLYSALPRPIRKVIRSMGTQTVAKTKQHPLQPYRPILSPAVQTALQQQFTEQLAAINSRYLMSWFKTVKPNYTQVIELFGLGFSDYLYRYGTAVDTWQLYDLVQWFETRYTDTLAQLHTQSCLRPQLTINPIHSHEEQRFIQRFKQEQGHEPLLYLLYKLLSRSQQRSHLLFKRVTGLDRAQPESKREVASSIRRTCSRLDGLLNDCQRTVRKTLMPNSDWTPYTTLFTRPYLLADDSLVQQVRQQELPELDGERILSLLLTCGNFKKVTVGTTPLLIHEEQISKKELYHAEAWIQYKLRIASGHARKTNQSHIEFEQAVAAKPVLKELMRQLLSKAMGKQLTKRDFEGWLVKTPTPSQAYQVYELLREIGHPMQGAELLKTYNKRHPDRPISSQQSLRQMVRTESKRIRPIGRRSLYGLVEWEHLFFGTVCDCIEQQLLVQEEPKSLTEIWKEVLQHFPGTTFHSVESQIRLDSKHRFVRFESQLIGLSARSYPAKYRLTHASVKKTFEERMQELEEYLKVHHCYPVSYGEHYNAALYYWHLDIRKGRLQLTAEQAQQLEQLFKQYIPAE